MRTKTMILTAAVAAAGLASSMAQAVYSVNAVGYVNTAIPAGSTSGKFKMIANPLIVTDNRLEALIPAPPVGTTIYKFAGSFTTTTFDEIDNAWIPAGTTLDFGGGAFIRNPPGAPAYNITFVGEVAEGAPVSNPIAGGFSIKSSKVPQTGRLTADLGFLNPTIGDVVYKFDVATQQFKTYTFDEIDNAWLPEDPTIDVGESFFIQEKNGAGHAWNRNFDVTP